MESQSKGKNTVFSPEEAGLYRRFPHDQSRSQPDRPIIGSDRVESPVSAPFLPILTVWTIAASGPGAGRHGCQAMFRVTNTAAEFVHAGTPLQHRPTCDHSVVVILVGTIPVGTVPIAVPRADSDSL